MPRATRGGEFHRRVLDAVAAMILVVDERAVVRYANRHTIAGLGLDPAHVLNQRGGDALGCVHCRDDPAGCGFGDYCRTECVIRGAIAHVVAGGDDYRRRLAMTVERGDVLVNVNLRLVAAPLAEGDRTLVLITIEDISELIRLQSILPICAHCKKIRNDGAYWESVEQYLADRVDVSFSHGYCPECVEKHYSQALGGAEPSATVRVAPSAAPPRRKPVDRAR
jgi:hypothetical protein